MDFWTWNVSASSLGCKERKTERFFHSLIWFENSQENLLAARSKYHPYQAPVACLACPSFFKTLELFWLLCRWPWLPFPLSTIWLLFSWRSHRMSSIWFCEQVTRTQNTQPRQSVSHSHYLTLIWVLHGVQPGSCTCISGLWSPLWYPHRTGSLSCKQCPLCTQQLSWSGTCNFLMRIISALFWAVFSVFQFSASHTPVLWTDSARPCSPNQGFICSCFQTH